MSAAGLLVREAVAEGGRELALERYHEGGLGILSPGTDRIPQAARDRGARASASLFAELAAVPAWELPLQELAEARRPSTIVVGADTPDPISAAAHGLAGALARSGLAEVGPGLPHHDQAPELAELVAHLAANVPRPSP
jgi:hypothetical protein